MHPLIVSARLAPEVHAKLTALRTQYFPPERNYLDAHLTLFHALAGENLDEVKLALKDLTQQPAPKALCARLFSLGQGFAVDIESPGLIKVRRGLAEKLEPLLGPQDLRRFRPHVTLQNKVLPKTAKRDYTLAKTSFTPMQTHVTALCLWHYVGGPWEHEHTFSFGARDDN